METAFYFCVVVMSTLVFFMKVTALNAWSELFLRFVGKVVPLFTAVYSMYQLIEHLKQ